MTYPYANSTTSPAFGLTAWLNDKPRYLPLRHVEAHFQVSGDMALVQIDQVFEQTANEPLDVIYTFPVPGGAAVHRCEMIVKGRVIRAVVMPEEEAWRVVEEHQAAGHRTALMEMSRDNLFTLELGNVTPGDRVVIRFAYVESVERQGTQLSLLIPFSPGLRYIPGKPLLRANCGLGTVDDTDEVPDASRITPPRIGSADPGAATLYLEGRLDEAEVDMPTLSSPTHAAILRKAAASVEVRLAGDSAVPDRDFVLRWEESQVAGPAPRAWVGERQGALHALLQIRAPQNAAPVAEGDFAQDVYFLLDRSGSMAGMKWVKSAEALHAFVRLLGVNDRVWLTCFESDFQDFDTVPLGRDALLKDARFRRLAEMGVAGGTELSPALAHVLEMRGKHSAGRRARVIVITDGHVGNEQAIIERMAQADAADMAVHCFGIDHAVNDAFLHSLARQTGGRCALLTPNDDIPAAVARLGETLRRPVIMDLELQDGHLAANGSRRLPDLHAGEVSLLAIRCEPGATEATVTGRLPDGAPWSHRFELQARLECEAPRLIWARQKIQHLLGLGKPEEAVALAIEHNLVCQGAAFVAWDELEKVKVAEQLCYQPSMMEFESPPQCLEAQADEGSDELRAVLREEGISQEHSVTIALLLQCWVHRGDDERYALFDELVLTMQNSLEPLECLWRFISEHIPEDLQEYIDEWMSDREKKTMKQETAVLSS